MTERNKTTGRSLKVAALFAGIGGLELGLEEAGHKTVLMSEWDPAAQSVLSKHFPSTDLRGDINALKELPRIDLLTGGFPCQDISFAGTRDGLQGARSGLVWEMFRLIDQSRPELVLFENVSNLLRLDRGIHMESLLAALEERQYRWAYRLVDTRGFGLPQRRLRVIILASKGDIRPADILFGEAVEAEIDDAIVDPSPDSMYGFYWTEGRRGVGWARDAVPTIKGGSGLGIPSPPAVYVPSERFAGTLNIGDAERLQGFPEGWTDVEIDGRQAKLGERWKMVGNAVSVPVSTWIGRGLANPNPQPAKFSSEPLLSRPMPRAALGDSSGRRKVEVSTHVLTSRHSPLGEVLKNDLAPLSQRALSGYLSRVRSGTKTLPEQFIRDLSAQLAASAQLAEAKPVS